MLEVYLEEYHLGIIQYKWIIAQMSVWLSNSVPDWGFFHFLDSSNFGKIGQVFKDRALYPNVHD